MSYHPGVAVTFVRVESCSTCQPNGSVRAPVKGSGNDVQWGKPPMDHEMTWSFAEVLFAKCWTPKSGGYTHVFCGSLWGVLMLDV